MRHRLSGRQLSRNASHRHALMRNMATSLLRHETIRTTLPKAKELRRVVEPLITLAKSDSLTTRRRAFDQLRDQAVVEKLFGELGPRYQARPGGYTRILRMFPRPGDAAPMALMELVDQPQRAAPEEAEPKDGKKAKVAKPALKTAEEKAEQKAQQKAKAAGKKAAKEAEAEAAKAANAEDTKKAGRRRAPKKKAAAKTSTGKKTAARKK